MIDIDKFYKQGTVVYPPKEQVFRAIDLCPLNRVKVVILGQDPYHGPGQANGLAFSVPEGYLTPPSLRNIYKELSDDLGCEVPHHGDLSKWAKQGVLLLNTIMTVEKGRPMSHAGQGWEDFTDSLIDAINIKEKRVVFLLWGNKALEKAKLITNPTHKILYAAHPSPFSSYRGFFGCKHFSKTNVYLMESGQDPIDWRIE